MPGPLGSRPTSWCRFARTGYPWSKASRPGRLPDPRRAEILVVAGLFLEPEFSVPAPLEETYRITKEDFFLATMTRLLEAPNTYSSET